MMMVAATSMIQPVRAGSMTIDDFSVNQGVLNTTGSTGAIGIGGGISRTLSLTSVGGLAPFMHTFQASHDLLDMTNGAGDDSVMVLSYNLPMLGIPAEATDLKVRLTVRLTDGNKTDVVLGGVGAGFANIPGNTMNVAYNFGIAGPPVGPGNLSFIFNGDPGWDLSVDSVNLTWSDVPEPSTYAMIGLGLAGLGLRRRFRPN